MNNFKKIYFLFCVFLAVYILFGCSQKTYYKHSEFFMGTIIEITCPDKNAINIAFAEIKRIEKILSKFIPDSEVSRLNKIGKLKVSPDLLYVLKKAKEFYISSDGGFDITVAPLVDIWKDAIKNNKLPSEEQIKKAKKLVGFNNIYIDEKNSTVTFLKKGVKIDLGAIAKGYAVDQAIKKIKKLGIKSCLIDAGGDIYCLGDKYDEPWQIGIQHPRRKGKLIDILKLKNKAVATSGDYEQMFVIENKRYHHIIDPNTGYPAKKGVISVTVIAPYCLNADALATAIFVLGKKKGQNLANYYKNTEALIYTEDEIKVFDMF
jgi:thiamine biosynthesis lipoprotein